MGSWRPRVHGVEKDVDEGLFLKVVFESNVVTLFFSLIILYYVFYMEKAVRNYVKGSTTIVQRQEEILDSNSNSPVFVLCADPPF